jgi:type II secretory pathway pseudopilin PulG
MEENKENVVEETTQETTEQVEETKKPNINEDGDYVVDLSKPIENETKEDNADDSGVVAESKDAESTQEQEEVQPEAETQELPALEEIKEEDIVEEEIEEAIAEAEATGKPLPENIQKLVDFIEETGGDINDYVKLNQDYSKLDNQDLLYEYYKQTKPHLNAEEINFLMEDTFSYDEDIDEEKDIRRKKLALKEQVASARAHLEGQKSRYYEEIKAGSKLTNDQQKAIDFFNRYNKESEVKQKTVKKNSEIFTQKTNQVFNDKFKGFEYSVGDKKYRFNVNNAEEVKATQSDINNFTKKFLDKNSTLSDAKGYHKSLFTAMNADAVAKHFYEQGKADALKESVAKAKNVSMNPRQSHNQVETGGLKFKVLGESSSDFKFKIKNNK